MNFLPLACYQIYVCREDGWILLRHPQEPSDYCWGFNLTPKKIVMRFFKLSGGTHGYYLVNLPKKQFYYCGVDIDSVKQKLESLNGLCRSVYYPQSPRSTPEFIEEQIDPIESVDLSFRFIREGKRFLAYDGNSILQTELVDLGINFSQLKKKLLAINGGLSGVYTYRSKTGEVSYMPLKPQS